MTSGSQNGATSQSARDCLVCRTPLAGALGAFGRAAGIRRSMQNPNLCTRCDAHMQDGRIIEVGVLFADLTGFTPLTARRAKSSCPIGTLKSAITSSPANWVTKPSHLTIVSLAERRNASTSS